MLGLKVALKYLRGKVNSSRSEIWGKLGWNIINKYKWKHWAIYCVLLLMKLPEITKCAKFNLTIYKEFIKTLSWLLRITDPWIDAIGANIYSCLVFVRPFTRLFSTNQTVINESPTKHLQRKPEAISSSYCFLRNCDR